MTTWIALAVGGGLGVLAVIGLYFIERGVAELNQRVIALTQMLGNEPSASQTLEKLAAMQEQLAKTNEGIGAIYARVALAVRTPEEIERAWNRP